MAKAATVDDLLKNKKPVTKTHQIVLDAELADQWSTVKADYDYAKRQAGLFDNLVTKVALEEAEQAYEALRPSIEDITVELVLQAIGRSAYQALLDAHPATPEQVEEAQAKNPNADVLYDYETFPKVLLAHSLLSPQMSEEQVNQLWESKAYNVAELGALLSAAMEVNQTSKVIDLKKG